MLLPLLFQGVGVQRDKFLKLNIFNAQVVDEISKDPLHWTTLARLSSHTRQS